jgi:hypothetical protein
MPDDDRAKAALYNFIAELNAAFEAAGPPSYARLETLSEHFGETELNPRLRVRVLATSTTHDILTGKRRSLPDWWWVVSFVSVLRVAAVENGLDPDTVGSVEEWKAKHQAARAIIRESGPPPLSAPVSYDVEPIAGDTGAGAQDVRADRSPDEREPRTIPAQELTVARRRYLEAYGRTGMRLLRHAEDGESEAAYRLAALLMCDDRQMEALYWLQRARSAGHAGAAELCADPPLPLKYWQGAEAANRVGLRYEAEGLPFSAVVFFERAGKNGHPDAAYRTGLHFARIGKT